MGAYGTKCKMCLGSFNMLRDSFPFTFQPKYICCNQSENDKNFSLIVTLSAQLFGTTFNKHAFCLEGFLKHTTFAVFSPVKCNFLKCWCVTDSPDINGVFWLNFVKPMPQKMVPRTIWCFISKGQSSFLLHFLFHTLGNCVQLNICSSFIYRSCEINENQICIMTAHGLIALNSMYTVQLLRKIPALVTLYTSVIWFEFRYSNSFKTQNRQHKCNDTTFRNCTGSFNIFYLTCNSSQAEHYTICNIFPTYTTIYLN